MSKAVFTVGEDSTFYFKDNGGDFPLQITTSLNDTGIVTYSGQVGAPCWVHSAWPDPLPPAIWVWDSYYASPDTNSEERISLSFSFAKLGIINMRMQADDGIEVIYQNQMVGGHSGSWSNPPSTATFNYIGGSVKVIGINSPNRRTTSPTINPGGLWFIASLNNCRISLFSAKGNKLFEDEFPTCDHELVYTDTRCPPETCECKHGNISCCINANGEVVKVIK